MASASSTPPSSCVSFPVSESPQKYGGKPGSPLKAPHLPFRRISLPTAPSLLHRVSVVSVASFDSLHEDGDGSPPQPTRTLAKVPEKTVPGRPMSAEFPRRRKRTRDTSVKPAANDRQLSKRRKVMDEFYETEKAYVEGLELVYSHFLTPIITSLDTTEPLLNRSSLTSIFSNFIDIWNLHRSFLSALTSLLEPYSNQASPSLPHSLAKEIPPPDLSPLLLSHFPYLSLYTPFVTAFPATISAINELTTPPTTLRPSPQYNQHFATFLTTQEADSRCGKLKLRDWLLTIVQRCPRYLLLLKDLINSTSKDDPEHGQLTAVHTLVSKITLSLNTSLHTHAQTMSLLALQRATPNLPFQLISPGRTMLKRGSLTQVERSGAPLEREFLLFSDCMLWLAPAEPTAQSWDWSWSGSGSGGSANDVSQSSHNTPVGSKLSAGDRPPMTRSRSKSEAELSILKAETSSDGRVSSVGSEDGGPPSTPPKRLSKSKFPGGSPPPPPSMPKRSYTVDDKWVYKGRVELVDVQVIVVSALEDERKFEILSPEESFTVYAGSEEERDDWASEIRSAKAQLLVSLNITNPNSTLTSSASTNHVRRALQALPYPPDDDRVGTVRASSSLDVVGTAHHHHHGLFKSNKKEKAKTGAAAERRMKVEHWVPAIWIPDGKTTSCMRCGRMFGWRRRRHHCRLCGRCVCSGCSGRTFFISDSTTAKNESKPARACDACYESVFPLIDPPNEHEDADVNDEEADAEHRSSDTITSLSHLPSWLSMPALPVQRQPRALMAIDLNSGGDLSLDMDNISSVMSGADDRERRARMRVKSHQRLRSYQQIVEDFQQQARAMKQGKANQRESGTDLEGDEEDNKFEGAEEDLDGEGLDDMDVWYTPAHSLALSPASSPRKRREDTARRSKRFSLPAIALHTTSVSARTSEVPSEGTAASRVSLIGGDPSSAGIGRSKRFSLVLAGRNSYYTDGSGKSPSDEVGGGVGSNSGSNHPDSGLGRGVAAARLSELLGRKLKA